MLRKKNFHINFCSQKKKSNLAVIVSYMSGFWCTCIEQMGFKNWDKFWVRFAPSSFEEPCFSGANRCLLCLFVKLDYKDTLWNSTFLLSSLRQKSFFMQFPSNSFVRCWLHNVFDTIRSPYIRLFSVNNFSSFQIWTYLYIKGTIRALFFFRKRRTEVSQKICGHKMLIHSIR